MYKRTGSTKDSTKRSKIRRCTSVRRSTRCLGGHASFMVGGSADEYAAVKSTLECMGKRITHCGDYGMGQAAKICNNMLLGISMIGVSEAMNLAVRLGLDAKTFMDIVNSSTGRCWSSEVYNPVPGLVQTAPANFDYKGGFSTDLITKVDIDYFLRSYFFLNCLLFL